MTATASAATLSRRAVLKGAAGGALSVGFALSGAAGLRSAHGQQAGGDAASAAVAAGRLPDGGEVDAFLAVHGDGSVTIYTGKVDLGTGLRIAIRQMAAEELEIGVGRIALVEGDTALTPDQGQTWGSLSIQVGGVQIRKACATAREALQIGRAHV